jgi:hypothetical protein
MRAVSLANGSKMPMPKDGAVMGAQSLAADNTTYYPSVK